MLDLEDAKVSHSTLTLAVQHCTAESEEGEFNLFPKLPIEIRFRIWIMTFKKQHVDLDIQKFWENRHRYPFGPERRKSPLRPIFPAALHVNRESRNETLRHYCIITTNDSRMSRVSASRVPICVNLSLDSCYFDCWPLSSLKYITAYATWLSKLDSAARGGVESVAELEVRNARWEHHGWYKSCIENETFTKAPLDYMQIFQVILRFVGLKKICFTWEENILKSFVNSTVTFGYMKECRETIQAFLEKNKDTFKSGQAPEVKIRVWHKQYGMFIAALGMKSPYWRNERNSTQRT